MTTKEQLKLDDKQLERLAQVDADYRKQHSDPANCRPMIIIRTPLDHLPSWEARLADPLVMLQAELDSLRPHLEIGDDRVASVRVQFGTPQVAAAFGCKVVYPENNLPATGSHVLRNAADVEQLAIPDVNAGLYSKLAEWTAIWQENMPDGVSIQHPDIQSPFNNAHLIRGDDILFDFYDCPESVGPLLDKVTDYMISATRHLNSMIGGGTGWFYDWGALWKGNARISNCTMQMISPDLYREFVLPRDTRFFEALGGGRIHYCGITDAVIDDFVKIPGLSGLDVDCAHHDFFKLCETAPEDVVIMPTNGFAPDSPEIQRLLRGEWPEKRNIIIQAGAHSVDEGKRLLERLKSSMP